MTEQLFKTYVNGDQGDLYPRHEALRTVAVEDVEGEWLAMHKGDWVGADGKVWGDRCETFDDEDGVARPDPLGYVDYNMLTEIIEKILNKGLSAEMARPCVEVEFAKTGISVLDLIMIKGSRVEIGLDRDGHEAGEAHGAPYPAQSTVVPVIEHQDLIIAHGVTPEIYDALADGTVTRWWDDMGSSVPAQELVLDVDEWDEDAGEVILKWELKEN